MFFNFTVVQGSAQGRRFISFRIAGVTLFTITEPPQWLCVRANTAILSGRRWFAAGPLGTSVFPTSRGASSSHAALRQISPSTEERFHSGQFTRLGKSRPRPSVLQSHLFLLSRSPDNCGNFRGDLIEWLLIYVKWPGPPCFSSSSTSGCPEQTGPRSRDRFPRPPPPPTVQRERMRGLKSLKLVLYNYYRPP